MDLDNNKVQCSTLLKGLIGLLLIIVNVTSMSVEFLDLLCYLMVMGGFVLLEKKLFCQCEKTQVRLK